MDDFFDLIQKQASYSQLVAWMQKHQGSSYQEACLKVNSAMQQYRLQHQDQLAPPTPAESAPPAPPASS